MPDLRTWGHLLATSEMDKCYANPWFQMKLCLLLLLGIPAIVFHRSVYGHTEAVDRAAEMPRAARVAAIGSLALGIGIIGCGRLIAYYEPGDKNKRLPISLNRPSPVDAAAQISQ